MPGSLEMGFLLVFFSTSMIPHSACVGVFTSIKFLQGSFFVFCFVFPPLFSLLSDFDFSTSTDHVDFTKSVNIILPH